VVLDGRLGLDLQPGSLLMGSGQLVTSRPRRQLRQLAAQLKADHGDERYQPTRLAQK
jgi:hypothetical protein